MIINATASCFGGMLFLSVNKKRMKFDEICGIINYLICEIY